MSLANDRDLVRIDPAVFVDAESVATVLLETSDGFVAGSDLTSTTSDFETLAIDVGHVIVIANQVVEVVQRLNKTKLRVSLPRAGDSDPLIMPDSGTNLAVAVPSFQRQIERAEAWVLGSLGIDLEGAADAPDVADIVNVDELASLVATETLRIVYAMAAALDPENASLAARAVTFADAARALWSGSAARLDVNGDGVTDATRRAGVITLRRM
jgi:hypothetical protein